MTPEQKAWLLLTAVKLLGVFTLYMLTVTYLTLLERKLAAWFQNRLGPNRVGPRGLLQPIADGVKAVLKEETLPARASKGVFLVAPSLAFIPALTLSALIPVAAPVQVAGVIRICGEWRMTMSDPARLKATASAIRPPVKERSAPRSDDIITTMPTMTPAMAM